MRIPGMKMDSPLMNLSKHLEDERVNQFEDVGADAIIKIEQAHIDFHSKYHDKFPGRPYLVFSGDCKELQGDLPFGITSLSFYNDNFINSDIIYEFSDDELSTLSKQGLFNKGFKVPDDFIGSEINVPVKCSFVVVKLESEDSLPLVFASIHDNRHIFMDTEHSDWAFGYEFDDLPVDDYIFDNEFVDDKSFEQTFGKDKEPEIIKTKEIEVDEELERSIAAIYKRAREREKRIRQEYAAKAAKRKKQILDIVKYEEDAPELNESVKDDTKDVYEDSHDDEFFSEDDFEDVIDDNISESEKDAEDTRRKVQKIDRAEDLQEENEKDEYVRRLADSTGISKSEAENQFGE